MEILDKKTPKNKRCKRSMSFEDFLKIAWSSLIMESSVHAFDLKTKQNHAYARSGFQNCKITLRSAYADAIKGNFCGIFVFQVPNFQKFCLRRAK